MPSVEKLKRRLAVTLEARQLDAALDALAALARAQPDEPGWPARAARLFRARSDRGGELSAMRRALELQVDQGRVLDAIASCKAILDLAPDDPATLETLDLLYLEDTSTAEQASGTGVPNAPTERLDASSAALETLVLTDVVPGARAVQLAGPDVDAPGRVTEIPIDGDLGSDDTGPLDLRLEPDDSGSDLRDLAAAQQVCLMSDPPGPEVHDDAAFDRGASLRAELANVPLFGELDPASLHGLIRRVRVVTLEAGQVLFRQGDPANSLYVVVEGAVVPIAEGDRRRKLAVLERGEFFGEIGLLTGQPRNATIEAIVDAKLLAIDRRHVWELIDSAPSVAKSILRFLRARLVDRQIRTNLLFAAFARAERAKVARQFRFLEVEPGTPVVERGRAPEGLFVVLSGGLRVEAPPPAAGGAPKVVGRLGLGDVFGGLSLIEGAPPRVTIVAEDKCWLVVLGEGRFRRILQANPALDRVLRRLARSDRGRDRDSVPVAV